MRLRGAIAVVCSMVMAACGGGPGGDEKSVPTDSELLAQADTCSESIYDWPATATDAQKTCAGPWQQQCCNMGSSTPLSCPHTHGVGPYQYKELQKATSKTCVLWSLECDLGPGIPCTKICDSWSYNFPECSANPATCTVAANAISKVNAVRSGCAPSTYPAPVIDASGPNGPTTAPGSTLDTRWCIVTAENAPLGHTNNAPNTCDAVADSGPLCGWDQTKITYATCPDPQTMNVDGSFQAVVDTAKCPNPDTMYTAPGLALSNSVVKQAGKKPPVCLTCEGDAPLAGNGSDAQAQAKFQCLLNRRADIAAGSLASALAKDASLDTKLIKNAELLFEFRGAQLSPGQRTTAEGLYTSNPTVKPDCSQLPDWAAPAPSCNGALDGKLVMCDRFADFHVSPALALLEANNCVNAWADVSALPSTCTARSQYVGGWAGISTNELRKAFSELRDTDPVARRLRLQERMTLAGTWYGYLLSANEATDQRWRDTGVVAGAIVQGAYSNQLALLDAASTVAMRDQVMLGSSAADQELIQAAFANTVATSQPPIKSAPLLFIVANALRATSDRLNEIDFVHDLGCRFRSDCGPNLGTRVSEMHALLSTLADGGPLSGALLAAPDVPQGWHDAFQSMSSVYGLLEGAVLDALGLPPPPPPPAASGYAPTMVTNATVDQVPVYALGSIVNLSRMKADHYAQTGRFRPGETMALETSLLQSKLTDVRSVAKSARDTLAADHLSYDSNFQKLIDDQLAIVRGNNAQANANDAVSIKNEQLRQLAQDVDGLRVAATVDLSRFGASGREYNKLVTALEQNGPGFTPHWTSGPFDVPPTEAKYVGGTLPPDLTTLAIGVGPGAVHALPGTLVQIEAQGQWSATCAIGASASKFNPPIKNYVGAMTGPQGYGLNFTNGHYETQGQSGQDFNFWDGARAVAGSVSSSGGAIGVLLSTGSLAGPVGAVVGAGIGAAVSILGGLFGSDHDNHSNGTEYHSTAAFNAGLHVPSAPFPAYPAGALLALKMKHLGSSLADLYDVEVVQSPFTTVVANADIDVYLAVNDLRCTPTAPVGALKVTLELIEPRISSAIRVQTAMQASANDIQTRIQQMLVQGRVLSSDLQSARSQAMTTLMSQCGDCTGAAFAPFLQYYTNWVDIQLNQAERQIEIGKVERQLRVAVMEWEALVAQVAQAQRDSAILSLLPSWAAQNIDENRMKVDTEWLVRVVDRYVYPFMRAKYPETLRPGWGAPPSLSTDPVFARLTTGLDWTQNWGAIADATVSAYESVQRKVDEADIAFKSVLLPAKVAISIPKPIAMVDPSVDLNVYAPGYGTPGGYTPPYRELDSNSSAVIWQAIAAADGQPIKITIPAELLYNPIAPTAYKYDAQLDCGEVLPVITNIGVFIANDGGSQNDTWNGQPRPLPIRSSVHVTYIAGTGPEPFYGTNPAWLKFTVQPQYGLVKSATLPVFFVPTGGGQGLSPAGEFTIEGGHRDWLDPLSPDALAPGRRTLALVLVIEVERRTSGDSATWVQQCH